MDWLEESKVIDYPYPEKTRTIILEKTITPNIKKNIPYSFTFVVLILGFFNLGSAAHQYYRYNFFSFLEITQGMVGILMIVVSIFLMIKLKANKAI